MGYLLKIILAHCFNSIYTRKFPKFLLSSADFFSKLFFSRDSFKNIIRVSISLDPDQDQRSVGPDLGSNCLQRLSADH